ncbi:MAG: hypothetical protein ABSC06_08250 [Rhodopila sp.]|jgi:hypothetical protein
MLFDQATDQQMQAGRIFAGAAMVAFLAAPVFRRQAQRVRVVVAGLYIAGVLSFVVYVLF